MKKFKSLNSVVNGIIIFLWILAGYIFYLSNIDTDSPYVVEYISSPKDQITRLEKNQPLITSYHLRYTRTCQIKFERWIINLDTNEQKLNSTEDVEVTKDKVGKIYTYSPSIDVHLLPPGNYELTPKVTESCNILQKKFPMIKAGNTVKFYIDK